MQGGLVALLLLGQTSQGNIPNQSSKIMTEKERIKLEQDKFNSEKPTIYGMRAHHLHDENKDGVYHTGEGLTRVYSGTSGNIMHIKEPLPGEGALGIYVPQESYWGTKIIAKLTDLTNGNNYVLDERVVADLTKINLTNSYPGKPQEVALVDIQEYRKQLEKMLAPKKPGLHHYHLLIIGENGSEAHSIIFRVDYSTLIKDLNARKED